MANLTEMKAVGLDASRENPALQAQLVGPIKLFTKGMEGFMSSLDPSSVSLGNVGKLPATPFSGKISGVIGTGRGQG